MNVTLTINGEQHILTIEPCVTLLDALPESQNRVGIDLGIKTFAVLSSGEKIDAPKPLKKRIKRLRKLNRNLSRKQKGSNRYEKA